MVWLKNNVNFQPNKLERPLFDEIWLEFQILYQWTPCKRPPISPQNRNEQRTKFRNQQSSTKNLP